MKLTTHARRFALSAACTFALAACGSGGGGSGDDSPKPTDNGKGNGDATGGSGGSTPGGGGTIAPGDSNTTPGDPNTTPGDPNTTPGGGTTTPGGGTTTPGGGTTTPTNTPTCEDMWATYVHNHPAGLLVASLMTSSTTGGTFDFASKTKTTETVLKSSDAAVETRTQISMIEPFPNDQPATSSTQTKDDFLKNCKPGDTTPVNGHFEIIVQRDESLTVTAGTFDTHYIKGKSTFTANGRDVVSDTEIWTLRDHSDIVGKMTSVSVDAAGAGTGTTTTTSELVQLKYP